jgi:monoamine oxidase
MNVTVADVQSSSREPGRTIAVVGGGIAGLYTALRLKQLCPAWEVRLFEAQERLGGRILSVYFKNFPFAAELGAMRFQRNHKTLARLVDHLGLKTADFPISPPSYFLRGRFVSNGDFKTSACSRCRASIPYNLREGERGMRPVELIKKVIQETAAAISLDQVQSKTDAMRLKSVLLEDPFNARRWRKCARDAKIRDVPLNQIGFLNLLHHHLSNEAVALVRDCLSLNSISGNWNAAEAIPWFLDDITSEDLYMFPEGSQKLIDEVEAACRRAGVQINTSAPVQKLSLTEGGPIIVDQQGLFDEVILALPRKALEKLQIEPREEHKGSPSLPAWTRQVTSNNLFKVFLLFKNPWWMGHQFPDKALSRIYTDGPLRQIYYFAPKAIQRIVNATEGTSGDMQEYAMILASYSDEQYASFWEPALSEPSQMGVEHLRDGERLQQGVKIMGSRLMEKIKQQLAEVHGETPDPLVGCFIKWGSEPYGGGWHTWDVGSTPPTEGEPGQGLPRGVHVCGEAYSSEQGWVEGALKSAEAVLRGMTGDAYKTLDAPRR